MNTAQKEVGTIRLYACGGAGTNIGIQLARKLGEQREVGFGQLDVAILDTSKSNLRDGVPVKDVYLIDGLDGSGQIRRDNHSEIAPRVRDMLQTFKPAGLNIVLSSGGGGSGSVIGPEIVSELLARDQMTVVILIGDKSTGKFTENTLNTLRSYDNISNARAMPVVMAYFELGNGRTRGDIDRDIETLIIRLTALFSRENAELDSRDLFNWLRYDRPTGIKAQLSALSIEDADDEEVEETGHVFSVATLAAEGGDTSYHRRPEYQCVGFLPSAAKEHVTRKAPVHFVISEGRFHDHADRLSKALREVTAEREARVGRTSTLNSNNGQATTSGLIL